VTALKGQHVATGTGRSATWTPSQRDAPAKGHVAAWVAWGVWALVTANCVLTVVVFSLENDALPAAQKAGLVTGVLPVLAFGAVGAVVVARRPDNAVGWLCCAVGLGQSYSTFGGTGARALLATDPGRIPGGLVLFQLGGLTWELSWAFLALLLLLFPNGRLPSRRWRPVVWAAGTVLAGSALSAPFLPGPSAWGRARCPTASTMAETPTHG